MTNTNPQSLSPNASEDKDSLRIELGHLSAHLNSFKKKGNAKMQRTSSAGSLPSACKGGSPSIAHSGCTQTVPEEKKPLFPTAQSLKGNNKPSAPCSSRLWFLSQLLLAALVLLALCSLLFFSLFAPYLARVHEPLVILNHRIMVKVRASSEYVDPVSDFSHHRLAGRREMMHLLEEETGSAGRRRRR